MADGDLGEPGDLQATLAALAATIDSRADDDPSDSYTAKLLAKGPRKCAQKIVEEAGELAIALAAEGEEEVAAEAADLFYHLLVGLRARGVALSDVAEKLDGRVGVSGLAEKASRSSK